MANRELILVWAKSPKTCSGKSSGQITCLHLALDYLCSLIQIVLAAASDQKQTNIILNYCVRILPMVTEQN
jgi:hypothetical protein